MVSGIILAAALVIGILAAVDFNACFIVFHKLFFSNDLWILDPAEDLVINILVEPFFADMALKTALYCAVVPLVFIITGVGLYMADKKRRSL